MQRRLARTRNRAVVTVVRVAGAVVCAGLLAACVFGGNGPPTFGAPLPDGGDAAADAREGGDAPTETGHADASDATGSGGEASPDDAGDAAQGPPMASFSATAIDFGQVGCGAAAAMSMLTISNNGQTPLAVSASLVGTAFAVSPTSLVVMPGTPGTLMLTATVPQSATPGTAIVGSLALFTNDPNEANRVLPLSATPSGAIVTGLNLYALPSSEVGLPSAPTPITITNGGNALVVLGVTAPMDSRFAIKGVAPGAVEGVSLPAAGGSWTGSVTFTPTRLAVAESMVSLTTTSGAICGTTLKSITLTGQGAMGVVAGWPSNGVVDFGLADCGGARPLPQQITLQNQGATDSQVTMVDSSAIGDFVTDVGVGSKIPSGGSLTINLGAPRVPSPSPMTAITGTLIIQTDADTAPHTLTLTVEPRGAALAFQPGTPTFGSFGSVVLLQSSMQSFSVSNGGNGPANVTLTATENAPGGGGQEDGGSEEAGDASADATGDAAVDATTDAAIDATLDATVDAGGPGSSGAPLDAFTLAVSTFTTAPSGSQGSTQADSVTFQPVHANATVGTLTMSVDATTHLCSVLPASLPLAGTAIGGGPVVSTTSLSFGALCGGMAPAPQTFTVSNQGSVGLNWTLNPLTGPGSAQYTVTATPPPGQLAPGASSTVSVSAMSVPAAPAVNPSPAALAAQFTITTDVPFDPDHVVSLSELPLGDQLSVSAGSLRFGEFPIDTFVNQSFTVSNNANPGSPDSNITLTLVPTQDSGPTAYTVDETTLTISQGSSMTETIGFYAANPIPYPATITFGTSDTALCTPLPAPIVLSGTGTGGALALSTSTLTFGTSQSDPNGYVSCGSTGSTRTLTLSNGGNQLFNVTGVSLGKGATSPFTLSGPPSTATAAAALSMPIGASSALTIAPSMIPAAVANPNDPAAYSDVLNISTDITNDTPHQVSLVMQPYGAIIATTIAPSTWTFGTIGAGSIGTYTTTIQNTGNGPATVSLGGLLDGGVWQSTIFGLQNNPTTVAGNSITALVGQFTPPSQNGNWSDQGVLTVTAPSSFCEPLPAAWVSPMISMSGSSNSNPIVTTSGSLLFQTTDCGSAPPAGQSVTLTNSTNQAYTYTVSFATGTWYTLTDSGHGTLPANGTATIVVNPTVMNADAGAPDSGSGLGWPIPPSTSPDDLIIQVATTPATISTIPISWAVSGAVLSLPQGSGPNGQGFYQADSTGAFTLPMINTGNAAASVSLSIDPTGVFGIQPPPPAQGVTVTPNIEASPELVSTSSAAACPYTTSSTATFIYSGPVCQAFSLPSVNVQACAGSF